MSLLVPCSSCGERQPGKLAQATWAWWTAHNERVAFRQRLCVACVAMTLAPLEVNTREFSQTCPACGMSTAEDMDPVYCTAFLPHAGRVRLELPMCPSCAVTIRARAQEGAIKLEDRGLESEGRGPQDTTPDAWQQLGIQPR